ncbi:hypothetical protein ACFQVC_18715 [Streptomyces monticola]|uniref:Uncharacterized protein n=1 Tax=Streptomyces monticola TaxID=2666263 RepID=A0ABW2JLC7_9ACTN
MSAMRLRFATVLLLLGALFGGAAPAVSAAPSAAYANTPQPAVTNGQFKAAPVTGSTADAYTQQAMKPKKKKKKKSSFGTVVLLLFIVVVLLVIVLFARNRGRRSKNGD